jgi:general stress protein 26
MANPAFSDTQPRQIERLLAAARETIAEVPFCWVVTASEDGGANARLVKAQPSGAGEDFWTRWFLTPRIGRKAAEIRKAGRLTLAYQHDSGNAFVALAGPAELIDDRAAVESRFRGSIYDDPEGIVAASLIAVRVTANHLELHVRGVTAEPWGRGRTLLDRGPDGTWRPAA